MPTVIFERFSGTDYPQALVEQLSEHRQHDRRTARGSRQAHCVFRFPAQRYPGRPPGISFRGPDGTPEPAGSDAGQRLWAGGRPTLGVAQRTRHSLCWERSEAIDAAELRQYSCVGCCARRSLPSPKRAEVLPGAIAVAAGEYSSRAHDLLLQAFALTGINIATVATRRRRASTAAVSCDMSFSRSEPRFPAVLPKSASWGAT